jgi:hypothetical protein
VVVVVAVAVAVVVVVVLGLVPRMASFDLPSFFWARAVALAVDILSSGKKGC